MSAKQIIEHLERLGIVDTKTLAKLRRQIDDPTKSVSVRSIVRYLVEKKLISQEMADQLLSDGAAIAKPDFGQATVPISTGNKEQDTDELLGENFEVAAPTPIEKTTPSIERLEKIRDEGWTIADQTLSAGNPRSDDPFFMGQPQSARDRLFATELSSIPGTTASSQTESQKLPWKRVQGNPWESKWLFMGFGLLALLVFTTGGLWWFLNRTTAEDAFSVAEKKFNDGEFAAARDSYLDFAENFGSDAKVPLAKAKAVNAYMRSAFNSDNWAQTKKAAEDGLPSLAADPNNQLAAIRDDLSAILPKTAMGLSQQAVEADTTDEKRALLLESEQVFELINNSNYIPTSRLRADYVMPFLAERQKNIDQVKYEIDREDTYQSQLLSIGQSTEAGDTNRAAIAYHNLVENYPILKARQPLVELVAKISEKESQLVIPIEVKLLTVTEDVPANSLSRTIMVAQSGQPISDLDGKVLTYLIHGTVYGLAAKDGSILWWRRLGFQTSIQPQWVGTPHQSDVIVCDEAKQQVQRIDSTNGRLIWRTEINEPFFEPAITKGKIFITTGGEKSKIIRIDIDTGQVEIACQLPQSATVGPVAHSDVALLYQMGRHSSLYIISQEDLKCAEVYYLGHQPDSIDVEPFLISGNLCVLVNFAQYCQAFVFGFRQRGFETFEAQPPFKIADGKVSSNVYRYGRSVIVTSDSGDLRMYELAISLDGDQSTATMVPQAAGKFSTYEGVANYFAADRGDLYVANKGIMKFRIQRSKEDFELRKTGDTADVFIGPIDAFESAIVHLRRRYHSSMVTAAAIDPATLEEIWRSDFAAPSLDQPLVIDNRLMVFSEQGDLFELSTESFEIGAVHPIVRGSTVKENLHFEQRFRLADGTLVLVGQDCDRVLAYRPGQLNDTRLSPLQAPANRPGGEPAAFGNHLLIPSSDGQVVRIDPATGSIVGAPFQPASNPNRSIQWTGPAVFADENMFVIGSSDGKLYSVQADGDRSLVRKGQLECKASFVSPLVRIGGQVFGVTRDDAADQITAYNVLPELAEAATKVLDPPFIGSLTAIDSQLFFVTADSKLNCLNPDLTVGWQFDLPFKLVGSPQVDGNSVLVAMDNGDITRLDKTTGKKIQSINLDQPLATAPFEFDGHWYVSDLQGVVHVLAPIQ